MKKFVLAFVALSLVLAGCAPLEQRRVNDAYLIDGVCEGIEVVVNFGILGKRDSACVEADQAVVAKEVLYAAGFETEGTKTYGDQIVCRVNGLPSEAEAFEVAGEEPHNETCSDMPPAFAYWALWIKASGGKWEYATEGIGTLKLEPGASVGLAFSTGGETPLPN